VTVTQPRTGPGLRQPAAQPTAAAAAPAQAAASPQRPVTSSGHVRYSVRALGDVDTDGLCPPLVSPAGDFLVVQQGRPPTWPTLLAQDGASTPAATSLAVFRIADGALQPHPPASPLPRGLLAGRSADENGFLVESPRPDGSRWIGRVAWASGELTWLVQGGAVNAHATLTPRAGLVFVRREPGAPRSELVLRAADPDGAEAVLASDDESYLFPTFGDDPGVLAAFALHADGMDLVLVECVESADAADAAPALRLRARRFLAAAASATVAYQACAAAQSPLPRAARAPADACITFLHPGPLRAYACWTADGRLAPLMPGSFAAVPALAQRDGAVQFLQSTPGGLALAPADRARAPFPIVDAPALARATQRPDTFILLAPGPESGPFTCRISVLSIRNPD
jgi:hypothetical protein